MQAPLTPQLATWRELAFWSSNKPVGHQYDLVSIEGQVVTEVREAAQDTYVLISDDHLFTARHRHPDATSQLPLSAMKEIPIGARVPRNRYLHDRRYEPFQYQQRGAFRYPDAFF